MQNKKLLVVGELNVDLILNDIRGFPKVGTEIIASQMNLTLGSSSAIFASNIAALGVSTSFCGKIGQDDFGDFVFDRLREKGVHTDFLVKDKIYQTGLTLVLNYGQDRANVTYCGAMEHLGIDDIPWDHIDQFDHLHFSNLFLQPKIRKDISSLFKKAKAAGLTTSLDLQTDPEGRFDFDFQACLPFVDIFLPNEAEIKGLTGKNNVEDALEVLRPFAHVVAVKMGQKGSILINKSERIQAVGFKHEHFVDAIGAGDSFNAGFIHSFLEEKSLEECLQFANLTGALNTTAAGGTGAFEDRKNISEKAMKIFNVKI
ncbi:sugar kinase, ribokinase [Belliella baltica DSM 15883]|uniref:Sugar kinase, ribokinase n=1 Tax=Belliella baltica (strain DSM 15883 / CIP 108006 / LMG 21964 / BA134) TaxID=866536 RepID=I3Z954_BELBD|nr:sugar kinase [Belliella baltica]AFL85772.1 sugar kinase, ribokinase [Belliella baltica DSM 15883]